MSESFHRIYLSDQLSSVVVEVKKQLEAYSDVELFPEEGEQLNAFIHESRKVEFLGVRHLRNQLDLLYPISYSQERKPYLRNQVNTYISISHSKNYCALGTSLTEIGIDIEEISPRIERIVSRFVSDEEIKFIGERSILDLTKLWTMKEAMFKLNNRTGIEFKSELIIEEKSDDVYTGKMFTENGWKQVKLECFQKDDLVISVCQYA
jgi:4'-phosphopantetheinyl transferase EntD